MKLEIKLLFSVIAMVLFLSLAVNIEFNDPVQSEVGIEYYESLICEPEVLYCEKDNPDQDYYRNRTVEDYIC